MFHPSLEEFRQKAKKGNLIPVYREVLADMETPVSAFLKIDDGRHSFLLESMEGGEKWARYSFLGSRPSVIVRTYGGRAEVLRNGKAGKTSFDHDPLEVVKDVLSAYTPVPDPSLPISLLTQYRHFPEKTQSGRQTPGFLIDSDSAYLV